MLISSEILKYMETKFSYLYTLSFSDGGDYKKCVGTTSTETYIKNYTYQFS